MYREAVEKLKERGAVPFYGSIVGFSDVGGKRLIENGE